MGAESEEVLGRCKEALLVMKHLSYHILVSLTARWE